MSPWISCNLVDLPYHRLILLPSFLPLPLLLVLLLLQRHRRHRKQQQQRVHHRLIQRSIAVPSHSCPRVLSREALPRWAQDQYQRLLPVSQSCQTAGVFKSYISCDHVRFAYSDFNAIVGKDESSVCWSEVHGCLGKISLASIPAGFVVPSCSSKYFQLHPPL